MRRINGDDFEELPTVPEEAPSSHSGDARDDAEETRYRSPRGGVSNKFSKKDSIGLQVPRPLKKQFLNQRSGPMDPLNQISGSTIRQ